MTTAYTKKDDGSFELTLTIPWTRVMTTYNEVVEEIVKNAEIQGFRKGKAPRSAVEEKLDKNKTYEEVLQHLLPKVYSDAIAEHKLHPIVSPKITLKDAKEETDWIILAVSCEKPDVTVGDYKKAIKDLKAEKRTKLWVPGQETKKEEKEEDKKPSLDEILDAVYKNVTVIIPSILLEEEVNKLLSDLIDQTKKLGLTVDQYLASTGRTPEAIRKEYEEQARRTITLEFALEEIADKEHIKVTDEAIQKVIDSGKTEEEKKSLEKNKYYLASILRRQETIRSIAES